jgi:hypothetical protein
LRLPNPVLNFLSLVARARQRRSKMTGGSTQLTEEIARIVENEDITKTTSNIPWIRRRGLSVALTMQRSGARSITPQDMI